MSLRDDSNKPSHVGADNLQRLLVQAYMRLLLLPEREDGSKHTIIASVGAYEVRLIEVRAPGTTVPRLRVELYRADFRRVVGSIGCRDLHDAGESTETFIAEAKRLTGIARD